MAKVLYITANPKTADQSFSLAVGEEFLAQYRQESPEDEIITLDLYNMDIPFIDGDVLSAWGKLREGAALTSVEEKKVEAINALTEQFLEADKYVFVTPLWNLGLPPKLKAYIDTFVIAGKSFKYTENGPVGLLTDKKAVNIHASGGYYSEGPAVEFDFAHRYLKTILSFVGIPSIDSVIIEGMAAVTPAEAETIKQDAIVKAKALAKEFAKNGVKA